jgi:hypothetical protein
MVISGCLGSGFIFLSVSIFSYLRRSMSRPYILFGCSYSVSFLADFELVETLVTLMGPGPFYIRWPPMLPGFPSLIFLAGILFSNAEELSMLAFCCCKG